MIFRKDSWEEVVVLNMKDDFKIEDLMLIDYNCSAFYKYEDILRFINEFYITLSKEGINKDLFEKIKTIVEMLNNLNHFVVNYSDYSDCDLYVNAILDKFKTFIYKDISEFNLNSGFTTHSIKTITQAEIDAIEKCEKASLTERLSDGFDDVSLNYKDYYGLREDTEYVSGEDNYVSIVSTNSKRGLMSIVSKNEPNYLIKEYKSVLEKLTTVNKDSMNLKGYLEFEVTRTGFYKEIVHEVNKLLRTLFYLLNSTSFKKNNYYVFDDFEISRRICNLDDTIERIEELAIYQAKSDRNNSHIEYDY